MSNTPVGGHKRKGWRLKKKHSKWFQKQLYELIKETLKELEPELFEHMYLDYNFTKLYL